MQLVALFGGEQGCGWLCLLLGAGAAAAVLETSLAGASVAWAVVALTVFGLIALLGGWITVASVATGLRRRWLLRHGLYAVALVQERRPLAPRGWRLVLQASTPDGGLCRLSVAATGDEAQLDRRPLLYDPNCPSSPLLLDTPDAPALDGHGGFRQAPVWSLATALLPVLGALLSLHRLAVLLVELCR